MTDLSPDVEALLDESYESDLTEEESEELLLLCGHGIGPKLSPAARAVWEAFRQFDEAGMHVDYDVKIAAALRAATDQVVPEEPLYGGDQRWQYERDARQESRKKLLAIAAELEGIS